MAVALDKIRKRSHRAQRNSRNTARAANHLAKQQTTASRTPGPLTYYCCCCCCCCSFFRCCGQHAGFTSRLLPGHLPAWTRATGQPTRTGTGAGVVAVSSLIKRPVSECSCRRQVQHRVASSQDAVDGDREVHPPLPGARCRDAPPRPGGNLSATGSPNTKQWNKTRQP